MSAWLAECLKDDVDQIKKRELEVIEFAKRAAKGNPGAMKAVEKGITDINTMSRRLVERYTRDKQGRVELKVRQVN